MAENKVRKAALPKDSTAWRSGLVHFDYGSFRIVPSEDRNYFLSEIIHSKFYASACDSVVDWGTMLQAGKAHAPLPIVIGFFNNFDTSGRTTAMGVHSYSKRN
jgi:hypothetical protein